MPVVNTAPETRAGFGLAVLEVGEIVLSITDNTSVWRAAAGTIGYAQVSLERKVFVHWIVFFTI